ncbi:unnamed protein product [Anisakis simplex]|uniref:Uncharacterized protein n=1 Tax=Anisakis simplex TaxID=6269 RepID=A0A0M3J848_ANISI|nr:unnamed protein product [Anisakis simplex]
MSWRERDLQYQQPPRRQSTAEYNLNGGRNAFRMASAFSEAWDAADAIDATEILRQHSAMRSFTESVDSDLPPAPELPQSLDIDYQYPTPSMTESDTGDTIVEVVRQFRSSIISKAPEDDATTTDYDKTLGATQKYPMMVPGPGHADAEQEMHESLLAKEEESSESDLEVREQLRNVEQVITAAARSSGAPRKVTR